MFQPHMEIFGICMFSARSSVHFLDSALFCLILPYSGFLLFGYFVCVCERECVCVCVYDFWGYFGGGFLFWFVGFWGFLGFFFLVVFGFLRLGVGENFLS